MTKLRQRFIYITDIKILNLDIFIEDQSYNSSDSLLACQTGPVFNSGLNFVVSERAKGREGVQIIYY